LAVATELCTSHGSPQIADLFIIILCFHRPHKSPIPYSRSGFFQPGSGRSLFVTKVAPVSA